MVVGPNYSEKYDEMQKFFKESGEFHVDTTVSVSYATSGRFEEEYRLPTNENYEQFSFVGLDNADPLLFWGFNKNNEEYVGDKIFAFAYIELEMLRIHSRPLYEDPMPHYPFNGCCVPGARKLYVTVNGDFLPCERVGDTPKIGDVNMGFDIAGIQKHYVDDYEEEAKKYCGNCWAINLCGNCYIESYDKNGVHFDYRHNICRYTRYSIYNSLIKYHGILETNPESLRPLNDIKVE